ncbi:hypothetical protein B1A99_24465 [Cohnella sp. CIP 111063]|uniref:D-alanyl-D-alanine carboxypeptidase family protein n=1 Tax=unclassified Cohnella TaxID=2636738 RepID=UPI000B8C699D|nr:MULTISPECIES: D-alanyl-D-alanine carboxypeptidase family protein [unclassified Cohnella]OXS54939.1 hypothetical protein B1A99_24465 [Cohnella sp. CIP 111063]
MADPESITVLMNKTLILPKNYRPKELDYPNIPSKMKFIWQGFLRVVFKQPNQPFLYHFVKQDGIEKVPTFSALPGSSAHETGLAIDISGIDGKSAALDCFAGNKAAKSLDLHANEYVFIIRYPWEPTSPRKWL